MTKTDYVAQVRTAVDAVTVLGPTHFAWLGVPDDHSRGRNGTIRSDDVRRAVLVAALRQRLYTSFFRPGGVVSAHTRVAADLGNDDDLVATLARANAGSGSWQPGWTVAANELKGIVVQRSGTSIRCEPHDVSALGSSTLVAGQQVSLRMPAGTGSRLPGWYLALSDEPLVDAADAPLVRLYWHVSAKGAPRFIRLVTGMLNHRGIPYELKLASHASRYDAGDGAVLYLHRTDVAAAWDVLSGIVQELELLPTRPALTKPVAPGVGLAEDPGTSESFGTQRCRWLAEALVRAWETGQRSLTDRMRVVAETWAEAGIAFEQPYLNPGSPDVYDLASPPPPPAIRQALSEPFALIECAASVGHALVSSAIWHAERCTWLGPTQELNGATGFSTLPPTLYDGAAGIALFLAELHTATPSANVRATALGALRQSLATADRIAPPVALGLYTGLPGIAWAAARISQLLDEPALLGDARALLARLPDTIEQPHESDLLSGSAGAIVALLHLRAWLGDATLLDIAVRLGDELLDHAEVDGRGWRWRSTALPRALPLTGFSHGASGIAHALVSLFQVTSDPRYREAALEAFAWERGMTGAGGNTWPDYRDVASAAVRRGATLPMAAFWCHGAPGIALARLAGWQKLGDELLRDEAIAALTTTRLAVGQAIGDPAANVCLCHGLAGNALILMHGAAVLDDSSLRDFANTAIAAVFYCPDLKCRKSFIGYYDKSGNSSNFLKKTSFGTLNTRIFTDTVLAISLQFGVIYNQAYAAEQQHLIEICGVGFRKALEFLIKDYAILNNPADKDKIEKQSLSATIDKYVNDSRVKLVAKRAVWLGNDETHYIRKWEGKNLSDLKKLIDLTVHWIEMEALTKSFHEDMPE